MRRPSYKPGTKELHKMQSVIIGEASLVSLLTL